MKTLFILLSFICIFPCSTNDTLVQVHFLEGSWKTENKEAYEVWKKDQDGTMHGYSYQIKAGKKVVSEYLRIKIMHDNLIYEARVPDQNNGQKIPFTLNKNIKEQLSFENLSHDFPKKIQYKPLDANTVLVSVLAEGGKGFKYKILKQPDTPKEE
jgi:hypothetical protein